MTRRESYGIDAPGMVRALGGVGALLLLYGFLPRRLPGTSLAHSLWPSAVSLLVMTGWMLASSLWLKKRVMRSLLNQRQWRGDEQVLDVGCGRGLVAIGAARRVPAGSVHAVDIWQGEDLSGNSPEAIGTNAAIAGVAPRLVIETADARNLPFADARFDVVTSMTAIHNISDHEGRSQAIAEAWRVLQPGGQLLIFDIRHVKSYLRQLTILGAVETAVAGPLMLWGPLGYRLSATKPALRRE